MSTEIIQKIFDGLDETIVGQRMAKVGLALALLSRQHAYLEGPPGCGKSALAVSLGELSGAKTKTLRFHRDMREHELLGEAVLVRKNVKGGEQINRKSVDGPFRSSQVVILDDMSRAPGEALAPLLRILGERRLRGEVIPLETAVTTALPPSQEIYSDPLEPSQLDRFAVQVRMQGLLLGGDWTRSRRVFDNPTSSEPKFISSKQRQWLQEKSKSITVPSKIRQQWLDVLELIHSASGGAGDGDITDRALTQGGIGLLQAHALLRGSEKAEKQDLSAARYMLARRAPDLKDADFSSIVEEVTQPANEGEQVFSDGEEGEHEIVVEGEGDPPETQGGVAQTESEEDAPEEESIRRLRRPGAKADVTALIRALEGRLDRGGVDAEPDPGGVPRRIHRLDRFDEILDADPVETLLLAEGRSADMPRALRRERYNRGGVIAVLRDVSASMDGDFAQWAGEVVSALVRAGAKRRMRVGYLEFNHEAEPLLIEGSFLHRKYGQLLSSAQHARAKGRTNYEAALRSALEAFSYYQGRNHHIVMLTDGVPVLGDPVVAREREDAQRMGVKIHTVFIGNGPSPPILDRISLETLGLAFSARPERGGRIAIEKRKAA